MSKQTLPPQHQNAQPGIEAIMHPQPHAIKDDHFGTGKLNNKAVIITGGDSGIGRAVAVAFAKEGARILISYLNEHGDAEKTKRLVETCGVQCVLVPGDIGYEDHCKTIAQTALESFGSIDILVNNAAEQHPKHSLEEISSEQLERTFRTNILAMFYLTKAVLPHMKEGSVIINSTSVTAYRGSGHLIDYSSTKGAIIAFTRSLSQNLAERKIRVNAVAPGPVWTPLIPSTFSEDHVKTFGADVPMERPAQPEEIAPSYVFLASSDSSYMTGQVLHPNGGEVVNG